MIKSGFLIVALGAFTTIVAYAAQPAQAKLTVGAVPTSMHPDAVPSTARRMVVDPERLFRHEPAVLWAGESSAVRDCIYDGRCGTIAVDIQQGCG
jgi:hypothetical protein